MNREKERVRAKYIGCNSIIKKSLKCVDDRYDWPLSSCIVCEPITVYDRTVARVTRVYTYTHAVQGTHARSAYARVFEPETGRSSKSVSRSVRGAIVLDRISGQRVTLTTNHSCIHLAICPIILKNSAFVEKRTCRMQCLVSEVNRHFCRCCK